MDKNRSADGDALMERYVQETESISSALEMPCSMLEMMIALCDRLETHILFDPEGEPHIRYLFWKMIESMGLLDMTDDNFNPETVRTAMFKIEEHTYMPNGKGGLFTVYGRRDMREMEIWYQAQAWLNEKEEQKYAQ